jgi:hypothetical protein
MFCQAMHLPVNRTRKFIIVFAVIALIMWVAGHFLSPGTLRRIAEEEDAARARKAEMEAAAQRNAQGYPVLPPASSPADQAVPEVSAPAPAPPPDGVKAPPQTQPGEKAPDGAGAAAIKPPSR